MWPAVMGVWFTEALVALHRTAFLPIYIKCVSLKLDLIISHQNKSSFDFNITEVKWYGPKQI